MLKAPEVIETTTRKVCCDGGGGALGHPRVYMTIGDSGWVQCGYCDRRFVLLDSEGQPLVAEAS